MLGEFSIVMLGQRRAVEESHIGKSLVWSCWVKGRVVEESQEPLVEEVVCLHIVITINKSIQTAANKR